MTIFDTVKSKARDLMASIQDSYERQRNITTLGVGGMPWAPPREDAKQSALWLRDPGVARELTERGSKVPSEMLADMVELALYGQFAERQQVYRTVDIIIANCPEAELSRRETLEGALTQGCEYKVKPAPGFEKDSAALAMAEMCQYQWQAVEAQRDYEYKYEALGSHIDYGIAFTRLAYDDAGNIPEIELLPPFGMEINHKYGEFAPNQPDAYKQHDSADLGRILGEWSEMGMVCSAHRRYGWQFYGLPWMLSAFTYGNGLIKGAALLPDGREADMSETVTVFRDANNNPVHPSQIARYEQTTPKARRARGEARTAFDERIMNGAAEVKRLGASGEFYGNLEDLKFFASGVCAIYGDNYTRLFMPEETNRAVMDVIDEMRYYRCYNLAVTFTHKIDRPLFSKMIAIMNWAYNLKRARRSLAPTLLVNPRMVTLEANWNARRTATSLREDLKLGIECYNLKADNGERVLSTKHLRQILARVIEVEAADIEKAAQDEARAMLPAGTQDPTTEITPEIIN